MWETAPSEVTYIWERSNFSLKYLNWFRDLNWGSKSSICNHTTFKRKGDFSSIILLQLRRPVELKFLQVCYFMLQDPPSEKTALWQIPNEAGAVVCIVIQNSSILLIFCQTRDVTSIWPTDELVWPHCIHHDYLPLHLIHFSLLTSCIYWSHLLHLLLR